MGKGPIAPRTSTVLADRRLRLADVVRFLGNEGVDDGVARNLVTATQLMDSPDELLPLIEPVLITLEEAVQQFAVSIGRLNTWIAREHLQVKGRQPFPARGGGKVLVDQNDVQQLVDHPPKQGRPPKTESTA